MIEEGISELRIFGEDVEDILKRFPNVKMAMFAENDKNKKVSLYYSRSGADAVTDAYEIGDSGTGWTMKHSPTDLQFTHDKISYVFQYEDDWKTVNYVYSDKNGLSYQIGK